MKIEIGEFTLSEGSDYPDGSKSVWIKHLSGEGGQFPLKLVESELKDFYNKHF